jgi:hypothetical protein
MTVTLSQAIEIDAKAGFAFGHPFQMGERTFHA